MSPGVNVEMGWWERSSPNRPSGRGETIEDMTTDDADIWADDVDRHGSCEACGHAGTDHLSRSSWCTVDGCQCSNYLPPPAPDGHELEPTVR